MLPLEGFLAGFGDFVWVEERQAANTNGGDFNSGDWRTRALNTLSHSGITGAALDSSLLTLPKGKYLIFGMATAMNMGTGQLMLRLHDTTHDVTRLWGLSERYGNGQTDEGKRSVIAGICDVSGVETATVDLALQHRTTVTRASDGFGGRVGNGFTVSHETYAFLLALRLVDA